MLTKSDVNSLNQPIKFYANQAYSFKTINEQRASFESWQVVHKEDYPIAKTIDELSSYNAIDIHIPFITCSKTKVQHILVEEVEIVFFINGKEYDNVVFCEPKEITIAQDSRYASFRLSWRNSRDWTSPP